MLQRQQQASDLCRLYLPRDHNSKRSRSSIHAYVGVVDNQAASRRCNGIVPLDPELKPVLINSIATVCLSERVNSAQCNRQPATTTCRNMVQLSATSPFK
jgi:hypothetical protein